eukprot:3207272-Prymnesium_polylepis.1
MEVQQRKMNIFIRMSSTNVGSGCFDLTLTTTRVPDPTSRVRIAAAAPSRPQPEPPDEPSEPHSLLPS